MAERIRLLFVDDETKFLRNMTERLKLRGFDVYSYDSGMEALKALKEGISCDVALVDLKMPGMDGEELLKELKKLTPTMEVIIITGHGSIDSAKRTTRAGAYEYLQKPCELDDIISSITSAYSKRVKRKNEQMEAKVNELMANVIGLSPLAILEKLRELEEPDK
jgi:DNA-binding NtrC family response regulator